LIRDRKRNFLHQESNGKFPCHKSLTLKCAMAIFTSSILPSIVMSEKVTPQVRANQLPLPQLQAPSSALPSKQLAPPPFQLKADPIQKQDAPTTQLTPPALSTGFQLQPPSFGIPPLQMPSMVPPLGGLSPAVSGGPFGIPPLQMPSMVPPLGGFTPSLGIGTLTPPTSLRGGPLAAPLMPPLGTGYAPMASPAPMSPMLPLPSEDDHLFTQGLRNRMPGVGGILPLDATLSIWQVDPLAAPFTDANGGARQNPDGTPMTQWSQLGPEQIEEQMRISRMIADRRHLNLGLDGGFNGLGLGASYQWANGNSLTGGVMPTTDRNSTAPGGLSGARLGIDYRFR
jgi:hypothetical protein